MNKAGAKPVAVFDIDGTIIRSNLVIEITHELINQGIFPLEAEQEFVKERDAWLGRNGEYEDYVNKIVKVYINNLVGKDVKTVEEITIKVVKDQADKTYRYTRDLITKLKNSHTLIAISGSTIESVKVFADIYGFSLMHGSQQRAENGLYTGEVVVYGAKDKDKTLQRLVTEHNLTLKGSIGIGDTESDISFLEMVESPIAFNPNSKLLKVAKEKSWKVVVERKDVVYELDTDKHGIHTLIS